MFTKKPKENPSATPVNTDFCGDESPVVIAIILLALPFLIITIFQKIPIFVKKLKKHLLNRFSNRF